MLLAPAAPIDAGKMRPFEVAGGYGTYGPHERAEELYLDGLEKLEVGRYDWARRTFESLIVRYPRTPAAKRARRKLSELNNNSEQPGSRKAPKRHDALDSEPGATGFVTPVRTPVPDPKWDREMRRSAAIQARMRADAGDRVFFSSGSAALGSKARSALVAQAQWLNLNRGVEATIEGHSDDLGTDEENLLLSARRAEAVRRRLVEEGVAAYRLEIVARGRTRRVATCPEAECRAQNRRAVTIVFVGGTHKRLGRHSSPNASNTRESRQVLGPPRPVSVNGMTGRAGLPR